MEKASNDSHARQVLFIQTLMAFEAMSSSTLPLATRCTNFMFNRILCTVDLMFVWIYCTVLHRTTALNSFILVRIPCRSFLHALVTSLFSLATFSPIASLQITTCSSLYLSTPTFLLKKSNSTLLAVARTCLFSSTFDSLRTLVF